MKILFRNIAILPVYLRLLAVMLIYSISRLLFYNYNSAFFGSVDLLALLKGGIRFDTVSVLYLNLVYIVMFFVPHPFKNKLKFIKIANIIFVTTNALGLLTNCIDMVYYSFTLKRSSIATLHELSKLNNGGNLFGSFIIRYWYVWLLWVMMVLLLCLIVKLIKHLKTNTPLKYQVDASFVSLFLIVAGLRGGDLRHSTRPIALNNAGEYVNQPNQVAIVLNTPFSILKTLDEKPKTFLNFYAKKQELEQYFNPVFKSDNSEMQKLNVVIFIIESYSEEASGIVNKNKISGGFTPFLDSLRLHSLYSINSFANGKKSIEAMPAVFCSIPSFDTPFALSVYSTNSLNSLPNLLKKENYHSAFFHGAPNGSMGFQAFANIIGFDNYYGKTEYNNDADFDGIWGIWDEPFLQFMAKKISTFKEPFVSSVFTLSSHDPFKVPEKYKSKFRKGPHPIYETLSYTDYAIKRFFDYAKTQKWYKNTLFVFTADHTSSHATLPEFSNSAGRYRIPLFFYKPDNSLEKKNSYVFQQTDIMPTVLKILKYPKPFLAFGQNLLKSDSTNFAINYFGDYQWIENSKLLTFDDKKTTGFYKLQNGNVLKSENAKLAVNMDKRVKAFLQQYQNRMILNEMTVNASSVIKK